MSLTGALSSAISALKAQSEAIAMVGDNIANSSTTGYKTTSASFWELVTGSSSASSYSSGGVSVSARANISQQGQLTSSTTDTNVAIQGSGFFAVREGTSGTELYYTRNGEFSIDKNGYLDNNGYILQGWRTDSKGNVIGSETLDSLVAIDTNIASSSAAATTETTFKLNLPADAATNATFTSSMQVYDSLGTSHSIQVTWTKTAANSWTATPSDPTLSSDSSTKTGTASGSVTITFNSDGSLASATNTSDGSTPATFKVSGWTTGAANSTVTLDLGTVGGTDGLTQRSSGSSTPSITLGSITSDGLAAGTLTDVTMGKNGAVEATYSNGQQITIYKIAVATCANADGMSANSGGMYQATSASGNMSVQESGNGSAGTIYGSELEASKTDTSTEFSNMIAAQQAYSAAAQVITTVDKMYDTLISAVR
jgi:flagellar hook protein FlgE